MGSGEGEIWTKSRGATVRHTGKAMAVSTLQMPRVVPARCDDGEGGSSGAPQARAPLQIDELRVEGISTADCLGTSGALDRRRCVDGAGRFLGLPRHIVVPRTWRRASDYWRAFLCGRSIPWMWVSWSTTRARCPPRRWERTRSVSSLVLDGWDTARCGGLPARRTRRTPAPGTRTIIHAFRSGNRSERRCGIMESGWTRSAS